MKWKREPKEKVSAELVMVMFPSVDMKSILILKVVALIRTMLKNQFRLNPNFDAKTGEAPAPGSVGFIQREMLHGRVFSLSKLASFARTMRSLTPSKDTDAVPKISAVAPCVAPVTVP